MAKRKITRRTSTGAGAGLRTDRGCRVLHNFWDGRGVLEKIETPTGVVLLKASAAEVAASTDLWFPFGDMPSPAEEEAG